ncbi:hypothetical protein C0J52_23096 [Blattella germanica]|nr:hypothetical protein C0J52_23096 [Blattella germanica]
MFPRRWIGRGSPRIWAPRYPDLTPFDSFAWSCMKIRIFNTYVNAFRHRCVQLPQQFCSMCSGVLRRAFHSASIWKAVMSDSSFFVELQCFI